MRTNDSTNKNSKNYYFCDYYSYWVTKEICLNRYKKRKRFCSKKCKNLLVLIEEKNAD